MKEKKSKSKFKSKAAVSESLKKKKKKANNPSRMSLAKRDSSSNVKLPRSKKKKEEKSKQKKKNKKTTVISALSANSTTSSSSSSASTAEPRSKATTKSRQKVHSAVVLRHDDDHYSPTAHMKAMMADLGHRHSPQPPEAVSTLASSSVFSHPPPRCPKERADRRQRRTHARAKKLFRRDVFGADEEEFRATKLHHHLNTYFPSDVQLVPVDQEGQSMRTTEANGNGNGNGNESPLSAASCGTCCCMKVFIVATLLISALMLLTDPCYPLKEFFLGPDTDAAEPKIISIGSRSQLLTEHFGTTFEPYSSSLPFSEQQQQTTVFGSSSSSSSNNNSSKSKSFGKKGKKEEEDKERKRKASLHCPYKTFYIALLLSGVLLYLLICACYSLQIIVRCQFNFWFLLEAALLLLYSFTLVGASVGAFLVKGEAEATVLGLIDGLLGLLVALWNYGSWRAGLTPLESDLVDDPEQNVVARVIGSRQISRLFEFSRNGKEVVSGKEVGENGGNGKEQEPVMVVILTDEKHD